MKLEIKYFADIKPIEIFEGKGDWIDLRAAEDVTLKAGEFRLIHLGVGIKLPKGYEAYVLPRSSTFKNFGIIQANSMGVIDESYCGDKDEWLYPAIAMRDTVIHKNDRICQFRINKHQPKFKIVKVEKFGDVSRGGFGTTDIK